MEITWDRIQALGKRLVDSRELEVVMDMGGKDYLVFTPGVQLGKSTTKDQPGRTHRVTAKGPWDLACDCPDYLYNDHLNAGFCKHKMAVMEYRGQHPVIVQTLADTAKDEDLETLIAELY